VKILFISFVLFSGVMLVLSSPFADEAEITRIMSAGTGLGANDLGDIAWDGQSFWVEGSGTLSNKVWGDGSQSTDWISYKNLEGFGRGSMGAFIASGDTLIASWMYKTSSGEETVWFGDGFSLSFDHGYTWKHIPMSIVFPDRAKIPGYWTFTYDIVLSEGTLWCPVTLGFLVKSEDLGENWTNILPDSTELDFSNYNHYAQCVDVYGDTVWVGTSKGMNVSFDRGETWNGDNRFFWPEDGSGDPSDQWPGNYCISVEHKVVDGKTHVWVGSEPFFGLGVYGICHTDDNGKTWEYKTTSYNACNFAFGHDDASSPAVSDSTVFAASDSGLVVSYDLGENWSVMNIRETDDIYWETRRGVFGVLVVDDTLWVSSSDGVARTDDWGENWKIFKGLSRVKTLDTGIRNVGLSTMFDDSKTYAFPNPFSPKRQNQDYNHIKVQYALTKDVRISISILDYSGRVIKKLISDEFRSGGRDYQETWDGRDSNNAIVPNGVYFYIIKTHKGDSARGKIMVFD